jgi:ATP-dependent exoDNAse (exonuclease V) beta subunit
MIFEHVGNGDLQDLESSTFSDGSRFYTTPTGQKYPSVTTVVGWEKREFFKEWREKNPEESKRILANGTKVHAMVEDYLNNEEVDKSDHRSYEQFDNLKVLLHNINNIRAQEVPLFSDLLCLAGRVDCVGEYKGVLSIIDFKTSKRLKSKDQIEDYFCQATAYAIMWQQMTGEKVPQIAILITTANGEVQEYIEDPVNYVGVLKRKIDSYYDQTTSV